MTTRLAQSERRNQYRAMLFAGCASATLLALSVGSELDAQSFQGSATVVSGSASVSTSSGRTDITPFSRESIINWTPTDRGAGPTDIEFQPAGTTANFMGGASGAPDFTVLNRIIPVDAQGNPVARRVAFNGTVNSTINGVQGGRVWFYSPTGIVIGGTATFNVGSLLLTTNDLQANGGTLDTKLSASFSGAGGSVVIQPGATINAGQAGAASYVAVFSPRVEQRGTINVDGQALLAAGNAGQISFNAGLVDIDMTISEGTDDANGIVHTGTTGGPASTGLGDQQQVKIVAVPKNTALTMLLSGTIGYTPAAVAAQDGSSVILQAGNPYSLTTASPALANLSLSNAAILNRSTIYAENLLSLAPKPGADLTFGGDTTLVSAHQISLNARAGSNIVVNGALNLYAGTSTDGGTISMVAGPSDIDTLPGLIRVTGSVTAYATGYGTSSDSGQFGLAGTGGSVSFAANGGTLDFGSLFIDASGYGGFGSDTGGDGIGGTIALSAGYGGTLSAGSTTLVASANGGSGTIGGNARGGSISIGDTGQDKAQPADTLGGFLKLGDVALYSNARGGFGSTSGDAFGGNVAISLTKQAQSWTSFQSIGDAMDGSGALDPTGGTFTLDVAGPGSLDVAGDFIVSLDAMSGVDGPAGSFAQGGTATIRASGGGALNVAGKIDVHANASVFVPSFGTKPTTSPDVRGGSVSLIADGGSIRAFGLALNANATGIGASTTAGQATGGSAVAGAQNGGVLDIRAGRIGSGDTLIGAQGFGGNGTQASNATGGTARLFASDGSVSIAGTTTVTADASDGVFADLTGQGFNATGGIASIDVTGVLGTMTLGGFTRVSADGNAAGASAGKVAVRGNGGKGTGGDASITVGAGKLNSAALEISALGTGGTSASSAGAAYAAGDGRGGSARFVLSGGSATATDLAIYASGFGGSAARVAAAGEVAAVAGKGFGGMASLTASAGTLDTPAIDIDAGGFGGNGASNPFGAGGNGGDGTGGTATLTMPAGSSARVTAPSGVSVFADAFGGNGGPGTTTQGAGGNAAAGSAAIAVADGAFDLGPTLVEASGFGGAGSIIGRGAGGTAIFALTDTLSGAVTPRKLASLDIEAQGVDGAGNADVGGTTGLTVTVGNAGAGLAIAGDLSVRGDGATGAAGNGFTGSIAGAPLKVGGQFMLVTPRAAALTIAPGASLDVAGPIDFTIGRNLAGSGRLTSAGNVSIVAGTGISLTDLVSGGTTLLRAPGGAVSVSNDLRSTGLVTVLGTSVDLNSLGALSFADADATAGNLSIRTAGNLDLTTVDATGSVALASTAGAIHNTGAVHGVGIAYTAAGNVQSDAALASLGALSVTAGGTFSAPGTVSAVGNVSLDAAQGMNLAGVQSGGTTLLRATNGNVTVNALTSPGAVTLLGRGASVTSPGALTFTSAQATAGNLAVTTAGNLTTGTAGATGTVALTSTGGALTTTGAVSGAGITLSANGNVVLGGSVASNGALGVTSTNGALTTAGPLSGAGVTLSANGNVVLGGSVAASGALGVTSTGGALTTAGALSGVGITLSANGNVVLGGSVASNGALAVTSASGTVVATTPLSANGNAQIIAPGGVTLAQLASGGTTLLRAVNGAVGVANLTSVGAVTAQGRSVDLVSPGALTVTSATASAGALSVRTAGNLDIAGASATGATTLTSTGGTLHATGAVSGDSVTLVAGGAITADAPVTAINALTARAGGAFTAGSLILGRTIALTSSDIVLGATARVGLRGTTQTIVLTNGISTGRTFIGGATQAGAWSLSASEALQLFADQRITITVPVTVNPATVADFIVGQLALSYGANANIGTGGEFKLLTPGRVAVTGAVRLTTSSAADRFSIDPSRIDVVADTGSIVMRDAAGALGGTLDLVGGIIAVASQAALTDIAGQSTDAINARLAVNDVAPIAGGWLQAGQINLTATGGLFIQNSGTGAPYADRRGFSANGIAITTTSAATQIVINGMTFAGGVPHYGLDTAGTILINGRPALSTGQFDRFSTINGCIIGLDCVLAMRVGPGTSTISGSLTGQGEGSLALLLPLLQYRALEPFDSPPLIDEPVTGVGNDDLWQERCNRAKDGSGGECPDNDGG